MEKLILRSVMYGADKIPDGWFEKVPGGFYKKQEAQNKREANDRDRQKQSNTESNKASRGDRSNRSRRNSTGEELSRGPPRDDDFDDSGYRSEGHRRRHGGQGRSSYDGGDDEHYYSGEDRRRRRQHGGDRRRRRGHDDDRRGYEDGYRGPPPRDDRHGDPRADGGRQPYPEQVEHPYVEPQRQSNPFSPRGSVVEGMTAGAGGAALGAAYANGNANPASPTPMSPNPMSPTPRSPQTGGAAGGYVPYSHIYGNGSSNQQTDRQPFSPPPPSSSGSVQPNQFNQVSPPVTAHGNLPQNPFAQQQAFTAAAAGAGAAYAEHAFGYSPDPRYSARHDSGYGERYDDRYPDENEPPYSEMSPPPRRRPSRRDYSPSHDSYEDRDDRRRPRERRRDDEDMKRAKSQGRGKSMQRIKENFDTSQRGLGYGAVGAIVGGLLGSEVDKGPIPMAIGAALGGLGANAFEARERYVDPRKPQSAQLPPQGPPR